VSATDELSPLVFGERSMRLHLVLGCFERVLTGRREARSENCDEEDQKDPPHADDKGNSPAARLAAYSFSCRGQRRETKTRPRIVGESSRHFARHGRALRSRL